MREIKFRAWDTWESYSGQRLVKEMVHFELGDMDEDYIIGAGTYLHKNVIVMQFTGLRDKNGKEIYEGDILAFDMKGVHPAQVVWRNGGFWVSVNDPGYEDRRIVPCPESCEVIGNIYENPELLKEKS